MRSLESVTSYFKMGGGGSFELVNIRRADNAKPNILQKWFKDAQLGKTMLGTSPPGCPSPPGGLQTPSVPGQGAGDQEKLGRHQVSTCHLGLRAVSSCQ